MSLKKRIANILLWSVISAAFIGPGTVTTASRAGSSYGLSLLWALGFSVIATYVLQETTARLTMSSGKSFGEWIEMMGWRHSRLLRYILFVALFIGCAAFQSGNLLGAHEGARLLSSSDPAVLKTGVIAISAGILFIGSPQTIAKILGGLVVVMSICYIYLALQIQFDEQTINRASIRPGLPSGAGWLVAGLIGTTVVPYNLFLGSGIAKGKNIKEMRVSLAIAIALGGLITMAVMITGTEIPPDFTFQKMYNVFESRGNTTLAHIASGGLVAAGLSSAITCPLAAALGAKVLLGIDHPKMTIGNSGYNSVWMLVLAIGAMFLYLNSKPIPAIIAAQAINGIILPAIVFFLLVLANKPSITGQVWKNSSPYNILSAFILFTIVWISVNSIQILLGVEALGVFQVVINSVLAGVVVVGFYRGIRGKVE